MKLVADVLAENAKDNDPGRTVNSILSCLDFGKQLQSLNEDMVDYLLEPAHLRLVMRAGFASAPSAPSSNRPKSGSSPNSTDKSSFPVVKKPPAPGPHHGAANEFLTCEELMEDVCEILLEFPELFNEIDLFFSREPPLPVPCVSLATRLILAVGARQPDSLFGLLSGMDGGFLRYLPTHAEHHVLVEAVLRLLFLDSSGHLARLICESEGGVLATLINSMVSSSGPMETGRELAASDTICRMLSHLVDAEEGLARSPESVAPLVIALSDPANAARLYDWALSEGPGQSQRIELGLLPLIHSISALECSPSSTNTPPPFVDVALEKLASFAAILDLKKKTEPIGIHRLRIIEWVTALTLKNFDSIYDQLLNSGMLRAISRLTFSRPFANMVHQHFATLCIAAFDTNPTAVGTDSRMASHLICDLRVQSKIVDAALQAVSVGSSANAATADSLHSNPAVAAVIAAAKTNPWMRSGLLGHAVIIANQLAAAEDAGVLPANAAAMLRNDRRWRLFRETELSDRNFFNETPLDVAKEAQSERDAKAYGTQRFLAGAGTPRRSSASPKQTKDKDSQRERRRRERAERAKSTSHMLTTEDRGGDGSDDKQAGAGAARKPARTSDREQRRRSAPPMSTNAVADDDSSPAKDAELDMLAEALAGGDPAPLADAEAAADSKGSSSESVGAGDANKSAGSSILQKMAAATAAAKKKEQRKQSTELGSSGGGDSPNQGSPKSGSQIETVKSPDSARRRDSSSSDKGRARLPDDPAELRRILDKKKAQRDAIGRKLEAARSAGASSSTISKLTDEKRVASKKVDAIDRKLQKALGSTDSSPTPPGDSDSGRQRAVPPVVVTVVDQATADGASAPVDSGGAAATESAQKPKPMSIREKFAAAKKQSAGGKVAAQATLEAVVSSSPRVTVNGTPDSPSVGSAALNTAGPSDAGLAPPIPPEPEAVTPREAPPPEPRDEDSIAARQPRVPPGDAGEPPLAATPPPEPASPPSEPSDARPPVVATPPPSPSPPPSPDHPLSPRAAGAPSLESANDAVALSRDTNNGNDSSDSSSELGDVSEAKVNVGPLAVVNDAAAVERQKRLENARRVKEKLEREEREKQQRRMEKERLDKVRKEREMKEKAERDAQEQEDRARKERERLAMEKLKEQEQRDRKQQEEKERKERQQREAEEKAKLEREKREAEEKEKLEREKREAEEKEKLEREKREVEEKEKLEREKREVEEKEKLEREQRKREHERAKKEKEEKEKREQEQKREQEEREKSEKEKADRKAAKEREEREQEQAARELESKKEAAAAAVVRASSPEDSDEDSDEPPPVVPQLPRETDEPPAPSPRVRSPPPVPSSAAPILSPRSSAAAAESKEAGEAKSNGPAGADGSPAQPSRFFSGRKLPPRPTRPAPVPKSKRRPLPSTPPPK